MISVPSTGQWIEKPHAPFQRPAIEPFQYPLRANGLRSMTTSQRWMSRATFQYPLRANGLRSVFYDPFEQTLTFNFSTLYGPMD